MALVEIVASNLHAGANLRKLEVGSVVEVDEATAKRWIESGKAKKTDKKEGDKLYHSDEVEKSLSEQKKGK